jgi:uncharacterized protein
MKSLALFAITSYKKFISPYKGFSCAHRVHNQGDSCSTYAYKAIEQHGLFTGLMKTRERLHECGEVHRASIRRVPHGQAGLCDAGSADCDFDGGDPSCCCDSCTTCFDVSFSNCCAPNSDCGCDNLFNRFKRKKNVL